MKKRMKRISACVLTAVLGATLLGACGSSDTATPEGSDAVLGAAEETTASNDGEVLNLYTWEGMFPQEVLDGFTADTGIKVVYSNFDTDETMLSKLEAAAGGDYDLVIADDYIVDTTIKEGLAQKLDTSKITNIGNVNPVYQGQFFDETNEYTVPYGAGVQTIVYNPSLVEKEITGYEDLWDESLADSVGIIGNYRVIDGMALKTMGESYNTEDTDVIAAAGEKLQTLAPNIRLIKDSNLQDDLLSGEVSAAVMYTSQVTQAMLADSSLKVVYPKEGVGFGIMAQFIPVNAPNADAAHAFIDYILQPEVAAQCFEALGYFCTNAAADDLINPDYASFLTLPDDIDTANMEMIQNISAEADEAHSMVWTEFRNATGQ